jgi:hypothetical protein
VIEDLIDLLPNFPGDANCTRCFAHIVNLIAKSLLRQFDLPKKKGDEALDQTKQDLLDLAGDTRGAEEGDLDNDNVDGWVDEVALLTEEEVAELSESVLPVRLVLVKV